MTQFLTGTSPLVFPVWATVEWRIDMQNQLPHHFNFNSTSGMWELHRMDPLCFSTRFTGLILILNRQDLEVILLRKPDGSPEKVPEHSYLLCEWMINAALLTVQCKSSRQKHSRFIMKRSQRHPTPVSLTETKGVVLVHIYVPEMEKPSFFICCDHVTVISL